MDSAAASAASLADRVEEERESLHQVLAKVRGTEATFPLQLDWLIEAAEDDAYFERSQFQFQAERAAWTVLFVSMSAFIPWHAWDVASRGGTVPVQYGLTGLGKPAVWGPLLALLAAVLISWARLLNWTWLGVRQPRFFSAPMVGALIGLCAPTAFASVVTDSLAPPGAMLVVSSALGVSQVLWGFWRPQERLE